MSVYTDSYIYVYIYIYIYTCRERERELYICEICASFVWRIEMKGNKREERNKNSKQTGGR